MSLRTRALPDRLPEPARRWALRTLFRATADAFGAPTPDLRGRSADAILERYAVFTDERSRDVLLDDPLRRPIVERRLHANTERIGRRLRTLLGIRTTAEALGVARRLYALIGIDLCGDEDGVVVTACVFATRYSPEVCRVMSATDAGLLAGLTGGGRLTFTDRLTLGAPACLATLAVDAEARR